MRRLLLSLLFAACAAQSIADHELLLKDSDSVTVEAVKGVMKSLGFNDAQADSILKQLSTKGEAIGAYGSLSGLERAAGEFKKVGLECIVRKTKSTYEGSDVIEISSKAQLDELLTSKQPALLTFYGSSNKESLAMADDLKATATSLKGRLSVAALNLQAFPKDDAMAIAQKLQMNVIPTIRFSSGTGDFMDYRSNDRTTTSLMAFAERCMKEANGGDGEPEAQSDEAAATGNEGEAPPATAPSGAEAQQAEQAESDSQKPPESKIGQSKVAQQNFEDTSGDEPAQAPPESKIGESKVEDQTASPEPETMTQTTAPAAAA